MQTRANLNISSGIVRLLCIGILSLLSVSKSTATHIVGGEIFYTNLGGNSYEITLIVYRDCGPENTLGTGFDDFAAVGIYNNGFLLNTLNLSLTQAEVTTVPVTLENPCFIPPPDLCIQQAVYTTVTNAPPTEGGYDLVYQRCCRNDGIINLINPDDTGMTMHAHIPGIETNAEGINSSAVFNNFPPVAMCLGGEFFFDHSATDPDGDLLTYELCSPFFGGTPNAPAPNPPSAPPFVPVNWGGGFSEQVQITSDPEFQIDLETGQITGTPTQLGRFAVGICVNEYRNGQLINSTMRDFQYQVTSCDPTIIAAIPNQTQFCDGLSFQFDNESFNASSFFWDFGDPNSTQDTSSMISPFYAYSEEGEYEVTLIANPTWPCADTTSTTYEAFPQVQAEIEDISFECVNGVPQYSFEGSDDYEPGSTLEWSFPNGFNQTSVLDSETVQEAPSPGTYSVTYTVEENGCNDSVSSPLIVPEPPQAILGDQTLFCNGFTFDFSNESQNGETYSWDFGVVGDANDVSTAFEPSFTYPDSGDYVVTLEVFSQNTCPDATSATYSIQGLLDPFFPEVAAQCFNGHNFDFEASGFDSPNPEFNWQFGNLANPETSDQQIVNGVTWEEPGLYTVDLAISENNCTKVISRNVEIIPNPIPSFFARTEEGCPPLQVSFASTSESEVPLTYQWNFGDGGSSTNANPTHEYTFPGVYDVSLVITSTEGCVDEVDVVLEDLINVYPSPTAGFSVDTFEVSFLQPTVIFTDLSVGGTSCFYDFGDGTFTTDCDPIHDFEEVGFLDVTQTISNDFGCSDEASVIITVNGHLFYAPNAFTPNDDGRNEYFKPEVVGVTEYVMRIYNRWGEVIFETYDHEQGWNGSVNGGQHYAPNGIYNYQIIVKDFTGFPHEYSGHISLIR